MLGRIGSYMIAFIVLAGVELPFWPFAGFSSRSRQAAGAGRVA